jgi:hypothetical protein
MEVNHLVSVELLVELNGQKWPSQSRRSPSPQQTLGREMFHELGKPHKHKEH